LPVSVTECDDRSAGTQLAEQSVCTAATERDRARCTAARSADGKTADTGATVCSCFGVGCNTITDTIRRHGLKSVGEVTACLKAGGNCGSCVPEIKKLLTQALAQQPQPTESVKIENIL